MESIVPAAFLSYAHVDDEYGRGKITEFRKALEGEVRVQTGRRDVRIFQDRDDIAWGQEWKERVDFSLDAATFLVPILTPSFFTSDQCRRELRRFLDRESRLSRRDLVLPVYWISAAALEDPARRARDDLAQELAGRQYADWRELRFKQLIDEEALRALARLATHLRDALDPASLPDRSAVAVRTHVTQVIQRTLQAVRTADPDAVDLVTLLVDAIRDSGRLPERNTRTLRWICQSRLDQPPGALRESAAPPVGADPGVDPAYADMFRSATIAVVEATIEIVVSVAGDVAVTAALLGALGDIAAHTGPATAAGPESALAALRQAVDAVPPRHGSSRAPRPGRRHSAAPVAPEKVRLTASAPTVSLSRQGGGGRLHVNLRWNQTPAGGARGGFFRRVLGGAGGIALDLAALFELTNGRKGVVQRLGNAFGSLESEPYVQLDADDLLGASADGENLFVNLAHVRDIRRLLVFAFIYEGVASFDEADAVVTLTPAQGAPIEVRLDERAGGARMCAIALLTNDGGNDLVVRREIHYVSGHRELDRAYNWGLNWTAGRK